MNWPRSIAVVAFIAAAAQAQIVPAAKIETKIDTKPPLRPVRQSIGTIETLGNTRLYALGSANDPVDMLGYMRGLYLDNYGVVFTSEISLIITPTLTPFRPTITKETHDQVHQKKIARLPALRVQMLELMKQAAKEFSQIPDSQRIVVAVRLRYLNWEDRTGLPAQIVMSATRKDALDGQVQTTEEP
jgi:hypothetical protein